MATYVEIASVTVGSGGASSIEFTSIPADYTDLLISASVRGTRAAERDDWGFQLNNSTSGYTDRVLYGSGSGVGSGANSGATKNYLLSANAATSTASTFTSVQVYLPNYAGSAYKSGSAETAMEQNATSAFMGLQATLWSSTAAITSFKFLMDNGNFAEYSTAYLYGIKKD